MCILIRPYVKHITPITFHQHETEHLTYLKLNTPIVDEIQSNTFPNQINRTQDQISYIFKTYTPQPSTPIKHAGSVLDIGKMFIGICIPTETG